MPGPLFAKAVHISQAKIGPGGPLFTPDQLSRDSTLVVSHRECWKGAHLQSQTSRSSLGEDHRPISSTESILSHVLDVRVSTGACTIGTHGLSGGRYNDG